MNSLFEEKLEQLMEEFPEYYIEVWGPEDFEKFNPNLSFQQYRYVVSTLKKNFNPNKGTNFKLVEDAVDKVTLINHWENEWDKEHEYELGGSE